MSARACPERSRRVSRPARRVNQGWGKRFPCLLQLSRWVIVTLAPALQVQGVDTVCRERRRGSARAVTPGQPLGFPRGSRRVVVPAQPPASSVRRFAAAGR